MNAITIKRMTYFFTQWMWQNNRVHLVTLTRQLYEVTMLTNTFIALVNTVKTYFTTVITESG